MRRRGVAVKTQNRRGLCASLRFCIKLFMRPRRRRTDLTGANMLKIWGRANSINVQKPLLVLEEAGVPYERIDAGMQFGVNDTPEYLARNPNGVVPTIDDDGFVLWESNAIARYLARKFSHGRLWPEDIRAQASQDRWMDWQQTTFLAPLNVIFRPLIRGQGDGSPQTIATASAAVEKNLAMLDAWLGANEWIGGKTFGVADCVLGPSVHRWCNLPVERASHVHLERWFDALMQRPSARKIIVSPIS